MEAHFTKDCRVNETRKAPCSADTSAAAGPCDRCVSMCRCVDVSMSWCVCARDLCR